MTIAELVKIIDKAYENDGSIISIHEDDFMEGDGLAKFLYYEMQDAIGESIVVNRKQLEDYLKMLAVAKDEIHRVSEAVEKVLNES